MEETIPTHQEAVPSPEPGLILTPEAQYYLNEGAGWGRFLGIAGFVFSGLILIMSFFIGAIFNSAAKVSPNPTGFTQGMGVVFGLFYALIALLYFFPSLYIYQFGTQAKKGILFANSADITESISKLKSFLKFWGVLMIIGFAISILSIIGLLVGIQAGRALR